MTAKSVQKPPISVIIPTYNRSSLLIEALESVFAQTAGYSEIIVADDGSTDSTEADVVKLNDRILTPVRYIYQSHTGMPGQVRNMGAGMAEGEYLAFLDSDDFWQSEKLMKQIDFFENQSDIKICHTRETWLRKGKEISQAKQRHKREGNVFSDALKKCIIGPSTVMMKRELFEDAGGFREDLEIAEDYEFWLRITDRNPVGYIDEPLVIKRAGEWEQLSEKYGHIELFRLRGLKDLVDSRAFTEEHKEEAARELSLKCRIYAAGCRKRGRKDEAVEFEKLADEYTRRL